MAKFSVSNLDSLEVTGGSITGITDLLVADGGTGASTLTDHGVLVGSGADAITASVPLTAGQMIYGDAGADPAIMGAGDTTNVLVGGGAGKPVWTEATGSGSPVRGTSPTFTTQITTPKIVNAGDITIESTGAGVNVNLHSDAGDDFTVDTDKLVVEGDTGFVGIGTTTPDALLEVYKTQNTVSRIHIDNPTSDTAAQSQLYLTSGGGVAGWLAAYSEGYTTAYANVADSFLLESSSGTAGGLGLSAGGANPVTI